MNEFLIVGIVALTSFFIALIFKAVGMWWTGMRELITAVERIEAKLGNQDQAEADKWD